MAAESLLGSYAPEDLVITLGLKGGGVHQISGYGDGTFVTVSRTMPSSTLYTGADNTGGRLVRKNRAASVTLSLSQFSESNDVLSALLVLDEQDSSPTGGGIFSIFIKDLNGRSLYHADQAFIGQQPDSMFGTEVSTRDWVLSAVRLNQTIAGNALISPDTVADLATLGVVSEARWTTS